MDTKGYRAQAPAIPAAGERTGGGNRGTRWGMPPPRRGQVKEKIIKDVVTAVANMAAGLISVDKNGGADAK